MKDMSVEDIDFLKENSVKESIIILIDSKDRDMKRFPQPGEFQVDFIEPFTFVYGIEILDTTIPRTMFMMEEGINNSFVYNCGTLYNLFSKSNEHDMRFITQDYSTSDTFVNSITEQIQKFELNNDLFLYGIEVDFDSNPEAPTDRSSQDHPILRFHSSRPFFINGSKSTCADAFGFNSINTGSSENSLSLRSMIGDGKNRNVNMSGHASEPSSKITFDMYTPKELFESIQQPEFFESQEDDNQNTSLQTYNVTVPAGTYVLFCTNDDGTIIDTNDVSFSLSQQFVSLTPMLSSPAFKSFVVEAEARYSLSVSDGEEFHIVLKSDLNRYLLQLRKVKPDDVIYEYTIEYNHTNVSRSQSSFYNFELNSETPFLVEIIENDTNGIDSQKYVSLNETTNVTDDVDVDLKLFLFEPGKTYTVSLFITNPVDNIVNIDCSIGLLDFYDVSNYIDDELFISKPWFDENVESINTYDITVQPENSTTSISTTGIIEYVRVQIVSNIDLSGESCYLPIIGTNNVTVNIHLEASRVQDSTDQWLFSYTNTNFHDNFITNLYTEFFNKFGSPTFSSRVSSPQTNNVTIGVRPFGREDGATKNFTIVSPGMLNLGVENYLILRCDEIEQHLRGSHYYNGFSPGLGVLNMTVQGFAESKNEFYAINYKEFHPIGRLSKMKFRFERKTDRKVYNFRNVNLHFLMKIKYYRPQRKTVFTKSVLNPEYNPDFVGYINNTYTLEEPSSEEDELSENEFPSDFINRENELMRDLMLDE